MKHPDLPLDGGCRCGYVRLRLSAHPFATFACHCTGCQRMSSSAYSLSAMVPSDGFEVVSGEPVRGGLKEGAIHHFVCPNCMSWLFTRFEGMDGLVNIRPTMLNDTSWFAPFIETYTSEKLPFAETGARRSFPKFPDEAEFPVLLQAYAEAMAGGQGAVG